MPRTRDRSEAAVQLVLYVLVVAAFAIGGLAHFLQAFVSLVFILIVSAAAIGAVAIGLAIWRHRTNTPTGVRRPRTSQSFKEALVSPAPPRIQLRAIDWYQFEKLIGRLLEIEGFDVERRGGANADGGVDLIARKNGHTLLVQCKHWQNWRVNPRTVRELVGTLKVHGGDRIGVFTLNSSTGLAEEMATQHGVDIVTEREILRRLDSAGITRFADLLDASRKLCPKCDRPLVLRQGDFPSFWGCSGYPPCRGKLEIGPKAATSS